MKNVCVVTSSRADFGLLLPLINKINKSKELKLKLVVTGSHLDKNFGNTINEIKENNLTIDKQIKLPLNFSDEAGMAKATSSAINKFSDYFKSTKIDLLVVLGDRYEIFGVCIAASMLNIPIAHIAGGEITQGAVDEFIRHSITKMSYLHFTECEEYRKRVIQLGEHPSRVFNVGALCVENINRLKNISMSDLSKELDFDLKEDYSLVTFHPVTKEKKSFIKQTKSLIKVMINHPEMNFIISKSNADLGGDEINKLWDKEAKKHTNWKVVYSLGSRKYLSLMKNCKIVIGNSSSGIIEAPVFRKPVINIGDRQKGRFMCKNIINCNPKTESIEKSYKKAESRKFTNMIKDMKCPFGTGNTSDIIVSRIEKVVKKDINLKKEFYDIEFLYE